MTDGDGEVEVEGKINRLIKRKFQLYWGGGGGREDIEGVWGKIGKVLEIVIKPSPTWTERHKTM